MGVRGGVVGARGARLDEGARRMRRTRDTGVVFEAGLRLRDRGGGRRVDDVRAGGAGGGEASGATDARRVRVGAEARVGGDVRGGGGARDTGRLRSGVAEDARVVGDGEGADGVRSEVSIERAANRAHVSAGCERVAENIGTQRVQFRKGEARATSRAACGWRGATRYCDRGRR